MTVRRRQIARWCIAGAGIVVLSAAAGLAAERATSASSTDWPGWRGPRRNGISTETGWLTDWPQSGPKKLWQTDVGEGHGSVAVVAGRVYTVGSNADGAGLLCLSAQTGKTLWTSDSPDGGRRELPAVDGNATPQVDDGKIYITTSQGDVLCFDAQSGDPIWHRELTKELGADGPGVYQYAASPLVADGLVIVPLRLGGGALLGLDKRNGKEVWRTHHHGHKTYGLWCSPVACTMAGRRCVVWLTGLRGVALDIADGKTVWQYEMEPPEFPLGRSDHRGTVAATPIISGNKIVAQHHPPHMRGFTYCLQIRDGKPELTWKAPDLATWYHSCVLSDGLLYGVDEAPGEPSPGIAPLQCYEFETGKLLWSAHPFGPGNTADQRRPRPKPWSSPTFMIADGKMILWGRELAVAKVSAEGYEILSKADLGQSGRWAAPVLSGGRIYCRTGKGALICLDVSR